jgi:hypothetical protein
MLSDLKESRVLRLGAIPLLLETLQEAVGLPEFHVDVNEDAHEQKTVKA